MNELSNVQIDNIMKKLDLQYNGCYSKDQLPELKKGFYIINLQNSHDGNGTHWTCLYYLNPYKSYYFDAFGYPPPTEVQDRLKEYEYNDKDIQNINSSACGYYCIAFIKFMTNKKDLIKSFSTFTKLFSNNTIKNDNILKELLNGVKS
jgi:hypothetical protein